MQQHIKKDKLIVVAGPTASGKTDLAIELAQKFNGQIINADSRQVYTGLDIATNKGVLQPSDQFFVCEGIKLGAKYMENTKVLGWLFDVINPDQDFNVVIYKKLVIALLQKIWQQASLPILVGGTGLYLDVVLKNYPIYADRLDLDLRQQLELCSLSDLQKMLQQKAMDVWTKLNHSDQNNKYRLIRKLEQLGNSQQPIQFAEIDFDYQIFYPKFEREQLYHKIDQRVGQMFTAGLVSETKQAIAAGFKDTKVLNSFGYKQIQQLLLGQLDQDQASKQIQQAHRNYAKRQITWFEGQARNYQLKRFDFTSQKALIFKQVSEFLNS